MFILWIAAAGTSTLDCDDYCNACSGWGEVVWDNLRCDCYVSVFDDYFFKRNISPAPRGLAGPLEPRYTRGYRRSGARIGSLSARTAFDALMVYVFPLSSPFPCRQDADHVPEKLQTSFRHHPHLHHLVDHQRKKIIRHLHNPTACARRSRRPRRDPNVGYLIPGTGLHPLAAYATRSATLSPRNVPATAGRV